MSFLSKLFGGSKDGSAETNNSEYNSNGLDLSRVFPRLKAVLPDADLSVIKTADGKEIVLPEDSMMVIEPYVDGLVLSYAIDEGAYFSFVTNGHLSDEVTINKIRSAALANLREEVKGAVQFQGDPSDIVMVTNGGNYEATMVLYDGFMEFMHEQMKGDFYVAIPARDLLYLAPKSNLESIDTLTAAIHHHYKDEEFAASTHALVRNIYERSVGSNVLKFVATV